MYVLQNMHLISAYFCIENAVPMTPSMPMKIQIWFGIQNSHEIHTFFSELATGVKPNKIKTNEDEEK